MIDLRHPLAVLATRMRCASTASSSLPMNGTSGRAGALIHARLCGGAIMTKSARVLCEVA